MGRAFFVQTHCAEVKVGWSYALFQYLVTWCTEEKKHSSNGIERKPMLHNKILGK
jgi:hypothetical protein